MNEVCYNQQGRKNTCIKWSQIPRSCTHERVTMNTVVQIKQCNRSCWLFPWLRVARMQTGRRRLSWTTWVGGIWPALAAVRSAISTPILTPGNMLTASKSRAARRHIIDWSQLWRRHDGGQTYVLVGVRCRVWVQKLVVITEGTLYLSTY